MAVPHATLWISQRLVPSWRAEVDAEILLTMAASVWQLKCHGRQFGRQWRL
jgi:hypothetical protein